MGPRRAMEVQAAKSPLTSSARTSTRCESPTLSVNNRRYWIFASGFRNRRRELARALGLVTRTVRAENPGTKVRGVRVEFGRDVYPMLRVEHAAERRPSSNSVMDRLAALPANTQYMR